jgi:hypothetical protein
MRRTDRCLIACVVVTLVAGTTWADEIRGDDNHPLVVPAIQCDSAAMTMRIESHVHAEDSCSSDHDPMVLHAGLSPQYGLPAPRMRR